MSPLRPSLRRGRFGRQGLEYLIGDGGSKGLTYLFFIYLASRTSVADFGFINLFLTLAGLLSMALSLGLPDGAFRFHFQDREQDRILGATYLGILAASVVGAGAVALGAHPVAQVLRVPRDLVLLTALAGPPLALRLVWLSVLKARQASRSFAVVRLAEPILLIALLVPWLLDREAVTYPPVLLAYTVAVSAVAVGGVVALWRRPGLRFTAEPLPSLLVYSTPLVFHSVAMAGLATLDQVVIQQILGAEVTGVYAYAYRFAMAMGLVVIAANTAWNPRVLAAAGTGESDETTDLPGLAGKIFHGFLVMALGLSLGLPPVARWIGGAAYEPAVELIPIIVYGYLWLGVYGLLTAFLIRRNRTRAVAAASGTACLFNLLANYLVVPHFGAAGAAWTTVAGYLLLCFLVWRFLGRDFDELPVRRLMMRALLFALSLPLLVWIA